MITRIRYEVEVEHDTIFGLQQADERIWQLLTEQRSPERAGNSAYWRVMNCPVGLLAPTHAVKAQEGE